MRRLTGLFAMFALALTFVSRAEALPILVSADATVAGGPFGDTNFGDETFRGGLLSGRDGSAIFGPYRFYLLFALPAFIPGTFISSGTLEGFYNDDWDTFDDRTHSFYQAASTWTESGITWNNQPGATGGTLASFNAATATPGTFQSWDLTVPLNSAYLAQSSLFSLLFRSDDETLGVSPVTNHNLEYFASREILGGARAFRIDVELTQIPEPGTLVLFGAAVALGEAHRRWTRARIKERTV